MICKKCGCQLNDGDLVCRQCGEPVSVNNGMSNVSQPVMQPGVISSVPGMQIVQSDGSAQMQQPAVQPEVVPSVSAMGTPSDVSMGQVVQTVEGGQGQQPVMQPEVVQPVSIENVVQPGIVSNNSSEMQSNGVIQQQPTLGGVVSSQDVVDVQGVSSVNLGQQSGIVQPVDSSLNNQVVQQQPIQQQPIQQQPMQNANVTPAKNGKKGNTVFIIIIILCLAVIGVLVYMILSGNTGMFGGGTGDKPTPGTGTVVNGGNGNDGNVVSGNTVSVAGYNVTVPNGLKYEVKDNYLSITDGSSMIASFTFGFDNLSTYKNDPELLKNELKKQGYDAVYSVSNFGGKEFILYRFYDTSSNLYCSYFGSEIKSGEVIFGFMFEGATYSSTTAFGYIVQIMNSASGSSSSNFTFELPKIESGNNSFLKDFQ